MIDVYVQRFFRKHDQEADHWANLGAEGQRKLLDTMEIILKHGRRCEACGDGSSKISGRSGCGVAIKGVDRKKWIAISKIAVPLGIGTARTADVVGVCVLTGIMDFVLNNLASVRL